MSDTSSDSPVGRRSHPPVDWRLYLVTDPRLGGGPDAVPDVVYEAVRGGVGVVQFRDKECDDDDIFRRRALAVADAASRAAVEVGREVPVFVNDHLAVARDSGLHLHVGQRDVPFARARAELPDELMVGLSIESDAQLAAVVGGQGAAPAGPGPSPDGPVPAPDVIGVSPVWATATKTDTADALGPAGADRLARAAHAGGVRAVGIGGVNAGNVDALAATALDGICVISALMAAPDPRAAAADLLARWDAAR